MSRQYTPLFKLSAVAAGAIAAYRAVTFADAQASVAGEKVKGIAEYAAADGAALVIITAGTAIAEAGAAIAKGDSLIVDAQGRVIPVTGDLAIAAGAVAVTSSGATGPLVGADLPEFVFADALEAASGAGKFVEILLRR